MGEPWYLSSVEDHRRLFDDFAKWYMACLVSLRRESFLWCSDDVVRICPFWVDRSYSEDILEQEVPGTFLVRISSEPGSFVLSVKEISCQGAYIEHYLIDALDLKRRSLCSWVMANQSAQLFLDMRSGTKIPKHFTFIESLACSQPHFINNNNSNSSSNNNNFCETSSLPRNVYPPLFDSTATDSDGSSSPINTHKYAHFVFGTS